MAAEHDDDAALAAVSTDDRVDDGEEVAGDENVRQGTQKRAEGAIGPRRGGELLGANLVRPASDRDRADRGEIGLAAIGDPA
ncbi:MAG TPA: hypothetical protein VFN39_04465 [Gemmatimonadaceae bacterium]|nr:hypothetical protein [Gemmatimonadaceae bacterium]